MLAVNPSAMGAIALIFLSCSLSYSHIDEFHHGFDNLDISARQRITARTQDTLDVLDKEAEKFYQADPKKNTDLRQWDDFDLDYEEDGGAPASMADAPRPDEEAENYYQSGPEKNDSDPDHGEGRASNVGSLKPGENSVENPPPHHASSNKVAAKRISAMEQLFATDMNRLVKRSGTEADGETSYQSKLDFDKHCVKRLAQHQDLQRNSKLDHQKVQDKKAGKLHTTQGEQETKPVMKCIPNPVTRLEEVRNLSTNTSNTSSAKGTSQREGFTWIRRPFSCGLFGTVRMK